MSYYGTTASRRQVPVMAGAKLREQAGLRNIHAGKALRQQAIQRTLMEIESPHEVWGIQGRLREFREGHHGSSLVSDVLSEEARARLRVLRGLAC